MLNVDGEHCLCDVVCCNSGSVLFFFFLAIASSTWKFLGQGLDLYDSSNPSCCSGNTRYFTHCTTRELLQSCSPVLKLELIPRAVWTASLAFGKVYEGGCALESQWSRKLSLVSSLSLRLLQLSGMCYM